MDKSLSFIVLPKEEIGLSESSQSFLLGGDNCKGYTICGHRDGHGSLCGIHDESVCTGDCGQGTYCEQRSIMPSCINLACAVKFF